MSGSNDLAHDPETPRNRPLAEWVAALVVTALSFLWFLSRLSPDIDFGIWQGSLLSDAPLHRVPLLSHWLAQAVSAIPLGNPAWRLNVATAAFGALTCGMLAAAGTRLGRGIAGSVEAAACGMAGASILACTAPFAYTATGADPATLTLFLGTASVLALLLWLPEESSFGYAIASTLFAGLAAVNHPSMGLLFFVTAGVLLALPRSSYTIPRVLLLGLLFLALACLPLAYALLRDETFRQFLAHAMFTPYPNPGDGVPDFGYGRRLWSVLTPLAPAFALAGLLGLFHPRLRRYVAAAAAIFLTMGPFLPGLVNQDTAPHLLYDTETPRLMALAMVCLMAGLGMLATVRLLSSTPRARPHRLALLLGLTALLLVLQVPSVPDRRQAVARDTAREILEGCPKNALLVSGDPNITSIVTATQQALGIRRDVDVLPAELLKRSRDRAALQDRYAERIKLSPDFPSEAAMSRWASERPLVLDRMRKDSGDLLNTPEALDFALWDLVMDNPNRWPICFIAVPSTWLMARAQLSGSVLCYPRRPEAPTQGFLDLLKRVYQEGAFRRDPGVPQVFGSILITSAEVLGRQRIDEDSRNLLDLADQLGADRAQVRLALSRAAARQGNMDEATRYASEYLSTGDTSASEQQALSVALDSDMRTALMRTRFGQVIAQAKEGKTDYILREEITKQLWQEDDIGALAEGYRTMVELNPEDFTALYHYAGTLTQLGQLPEAQTALSKAAGASPAGIGRRLESEASRFALLRVYHSRQPAPPQ